MLTFSPHETSQPTSQEAEKPAPNEPQTGRKMA
jgi:hypothetical protein